jgi:thiamine biosynthesis lipoprotein
MGTAYTVKVAAPELSGEKQRGIERAIQEELTEVNEKMSTYLETSELSRFNRLAHTSAFPVSRETLMVFREAHRISELSNGAFDVTVGPLVDAWGFGPSQPSTTPDETRLAALREHVGWAKIEADAERSTLRKTDPAVSCDLSAIAKGFAVDQVSETLARLGYVHHMVEVGGEVRTSGQNMSGRAWRIGIEQPEPGRRKVHRIVPLEDLSLATSGDYRNFFESQGQRLSHTINPRTGRPIAHRLASVSVVDPSCMRADGYATALMVLGEDDGYRLAEAQGWAVLFLVHDDSGGFNERQTTAFQSLLGRAEVDPGGKRREN